MKTNKTFQRYIDAYDKLNGFMNLHSIGKTDEKENLRKHPKTLYDQIQDNQEDDFRNVELLTEEDVHEYYQLIAELKLARESFKYGK